MAGSVQDEGVLASTGGLPLAVPNKGGWRAGVLAALLALAAAAGLHQAAGGAARPTAGAGAASPTGLATLPLGLQGPASSVLGESGAAYRIGAGEGTLSAVNPAQALRASFSRAGVSIASKDARIALGLTGLSFGSSRTALGAAAPVSHANRVSYDHPNIAEWYSNGPLGLEQGFTVARAPREASPTMTISLALSTNAAARLADAGHSVLFTRHGRSAIRYDGLQVTDAAGRLLPAGFELRRGQILIRADIRHARFPVTVDPFVQQGGKLTGSGGKMGRAVAVSADGGTAIVGVPQFDEALVFTRSGSTWNLQATLKTTEERGRFGSSFGASVALSADGEVALVGAPGDLEEEGAAWIYTRSGSTWHQAGTRFQDSECVWCRTGVEGNEPESGEIRYGISVALSASGETAIIGAPGQEETEGAAIILTRSGSVWHQTAEFVGEGEGGRRTAEFGYSVALSGDGATALIGGPSDGPTYGEAEGAAWVFTSSGGKWTQQGPKLTGGEEVGSQGYFGEAVSLSSDGDTGLIGGAGDDGNDGAAWVFTRSGESWSQQGPKLTASGETEGGWFGAALTLSGDGSRALIGAPRNDASAGAAWEFTRSEEAWTQGQEITATGESGAGRFGESLSLSEAGDLALIGAPAETGGGSARSFVPVGHPCALDRRRHRTDDELGDAARDREPGRRGSHLVRLRIWHDQRLWLECALLRRARRGRRSGRRLGAGGRTD